MTVLRRAAVALLVVAPTLALAGPAQPAGAAAARSDACTKLSPDDLDATLLRSYADAADDVFVGQVDGVSTMSEGGHKPRDYTYGVQVQKVFEGDLGSGDVVSLVTSAKRTQDGLGRLHLRSTYLFFTTDVEVSHHQSLPPNAPKRLRKAQHRPTVMAVACAGTTELPDGLSAGLRDQIDQLLAGDGTPAVAPVLSDPSGGASEPPTLSRTVAPGIALALLGVLGLGLFSWLGRRRA